MESDNGNFITHTDGVHHRRLAGPLEIVIAYFNINSLFFMLA